MRGKARERYTEISDILDQSDDLQITSAFCTCTNVSIYVPVVGCLFCMVTFGVFFFIVTAHFIQLLKNQAGRSVEKTVFSSCYE